MIRKKKSRDFSNQPKNSLEFRLRSQSEEVDVDSKEISYCRFCEASIYFNPFTGGWEVPDEPFGAVCLVAPDLDNPYSIHSPLHKINSHMLAQVISAIKAGN